MQSISTALIAWYDTNYRILPWRVSPCAILRGIKPNPYHVYLSEIMLQQTTVEAVKPYFIKFLQKWPNIQALAASEEEEILQAWAGLGYYSRARNLKKCANQIATHYAGVFPNNVAALRKLAGIGEYTAAAIAAIAFQQSVAVVDANVERVVARLFAIKQALPKAKTAIKQQTATLTPKKRAGDFAQAMMDLGAAICTNKKPKCTICPIHTFCQAYKLNEAELYPFKALKKPRPMRMGAGFIAINNNAIYLQKRSDEGLLGGMTQIPNHFSENGDTSIKNAPFAADWHLQGEINHIFTHFSLNLHIYLAKKIKKEQIKPTNNGWWCKLEDLQKQALPTVMKKAISKALNIKFSKNH